LADSAAGVLGAELDEADADAAAVEALELAERGGPFAAGTACAPVVLVGVVLVAWLDAPVEVFAAVDVAALVAALAAALIARTDAVDVLADGVTLIARTELVEPELAGFAVATGPAARAGAAGTGEAGA
jgi:hypothetical protein